MYKYAHAYTRTFTASRISYNFVRSASLVATDPICSIVYRPIYSPIRMRRFVRQRVFRFLYRVIITASAKFLFLLFLFSFPLKAHQVGSTIKFQTSNFNLPLDRTCRPFPFFFLSSISFAFFPLFYHVCTTRGFSRL